MDPVTLATPAVVAAADVLLSGTASPNVSLRVLDAAGAVVGTATVGADGRYSVRVSRPGSSAFDLTVEAFNAQSDAGLPAADPLRAQILARQAVAVPAVVTPPVVTPPVTPGTVAPVPATGPLGLLLGMGLLAGLGVWRRGAKQAANLA